MTHNTSSDKENSSSGRDAGEPVTFDTALGFVDKVKHHYSKDTDVYNKFIKLLEAYQRESMPIQDVHDQIRVLFSGSPELQADFERFLPVGAESSVDTAGESAS